MAVFLYCMGAFMVASLLLFEVLGASDELTLFDGFVLDGEMVALNKDDFLCSLCVDVGCFCFCMSLLAVANGSGGNSSSLITSGWWFARVLVLFVNLALDSLCPGEVPESLDSVLAFFIKMSDSVFWVFLLDFLFEVFSS